MVNIFLSSFVFIVIYYGLVDVFINPVSDLVTEVHKRSKRRIVYKILYLFLYVVLIPYMIVDKILGGTNER